MQNNEYGGMANQSMSNLAGYMPQTPSQASLGAGNYSNFNLANDTQNSSALPTPTASEMHAAYPMPTQYSAPSREQLPIQMTQ
jgi:hypothetical protein